MGMLIFHRVFKGDDMDGFGFVDLIQYCRQGRRFSGTRGAGDKYEAVFFLGNLIHGFWQIAFLDRRYF